MNKGKEEGRGYPYAPDGWFILPRMTQYASAAGGRIYSYYRCARLARLGKGSCPSLEGYRSRKNHRAENVEQLVWEFVSDLMKDPARLKEDLERMIELEKSGVHGDPEAAAKTWLDKLAELGQMRQGFQEQAARGYMTFDELGVALDELEQTRHAAERELAALQSRREALERLELDKEALLEHYARIAPEALDSLTLEERHRLYKMLRLEVHVRPDSSLEVSGVFGETVSLSDFELVPRYESQTTKSPELIFSALVDDNGARNVRFERVLCT